MSILNKEMYGAFIEAGVAKESASRAAESVEHSDLDKRLAIVETKRGQSKIKDNIIILDFTLTPFIWSLQLKRGAVSRLFAQYA